MPEMPHEAEVANVSGTVTLHAIIGIDGRPHDLQYVSGPPLLAQAAIDTVTWWQYRINQENVEVDTTIPVVFQPRDN
jgi:outer membrane biosynthesis protein TonB